MMKIFILFLEVKFVEEKGSIMILKLLDIPLWGSMGLYVSIATNSRYL